MIDAIAASQASQNPRASAMSSATNSSNSAMQMEDFLQLLTSQISNQEYKRAFTGNMGPIAGAPLGGIVEQGGKIWNRDNLFNEYFKDIIPKILPNGIILKTVDAISDENGVAIIQEGDAEGKNGEYDNKYVWIFKMKDGLIHSVREYNSDILVATQLYDYKLIPLEKE